MSCVLRLGSITRTLENLVFVPRSLCRAKLERLPPSPSHRRSEAPCLPTPLAKLRWFNYSSSWALEIKAAGVLVGAFVIIVYGDHMINLMWLPSIQSRTALFMGAMDGNADVVRILVDTGRM